MSQAQQTGSAKVRGGGTVLGYAEGRPRIALAGNPNCGKTTAFNAWTGARQHVGNYPGVTVERKEGVAHARGQAVHLVDLPGTYSLTAYSMEEVVVRRELTENAPLAVIDMADASALERNLYLTVQLLEMGQPLVLALNMMDEARKAGYQIDTARLSRALASPVVETVARSGEGLDAALSAALEIGHSESARKGLRISYGSDLDPVLGSMERQITEAGIWKGAAPVRWFAVKLLEGDAEAWSQLQAADSRLEAVLRAEYNTVAAHIRSTTGKCLHTSIQFRTVKSRNYRTFYICKFCGQHLIGLFGIKITFFIKENNFGCVNECISEIFSHNLTIQKFTAGCRIISSNLGKKILTDDLEIFLQRNFKSKPVNN